VAEGTGARAAVPGYAVAGKTGTAQKPDPATRLYSRRPGVLSFVGFVPAHDPRLAMLVMLDEPKTVAWGSEAAAPLFAAVAGQVLRRLEIPPSDVPSVQILRTAGAPSGPAAPVPPSPGGTGLLEALDGEALMPDVTGRSLRQALVLLAGHDLDLSVTGRGVVVRQSPPAGSPLPAGAFCRLELEPPVQHAADGPDGRRAADAPRPGDPRIGTPSRAEARPNRPLVGR
jgi:cell division protein FtsI (penicillin-binding protein 3)